MKQQAIQYVALDVHQATLVVSVRDEQGSVVMRATVATEVPALATDWVEVGGCVADRARARRRDHRNRLHEPAAYVGIVGGVGRWSVVGLPDVSERIDR